jgi:hypothetical protein
LSTNHPELQIPQIGAKVAGASNASGIPKGEVRLVIQSSQVLDFREFAMRQKTETLFDMKNIVEQTLAARGQSK